MQREQIYDGYMRAAQEDRCALRYPVRLPASLRLAGAPPFAILVINIALAGFSYAAQSSAQPGMHGWFTTYGQPALGCEIIWNNGNEVGCAFAALISQDQLDALILRHGTHARSA